MLVRHLSYFVTLARERHFARAAQLCNIAQPTLSAAIRKLEEALGVQLVIRSPRFVGLTAEGEKVLMWGRQIVTDYNSLRDDISGAGRALTGTLRLGVIPAAMPAISFVTSRFARTHPAATVDVRSMTSREIERMLHAFEIDGGATYLENEPLENLRQMPLYRERYVFVARRTAALAARQAISWKEAASKPLCLLSDDMQNRRIIDKLAKSIGVTVSPKIVSNSFLGVCSHLRHGEWASIVPHSFFYVFGAAPDLIALDLVEPVHSQMIGLVLLDRQPPSPMAGALLRSVLNLDVEAGLKEARP
ncbi:transcriptional regulator, LysR family [Methylocella silvestris BL2]|uniref:Transcriptional regulator, LysR family n=1 Tax=Methylocella silvestris (strain DSM 15510 / CIP 108128 / LMG 27833 / NCIMB 13906 / BL2) TaxID=395965 RepID=B8EKL1_METSB|nr:LysR family transcriptional regulator [Methylocella silvestris]ACK51381.1 transcriptional regulator, LysR family [Methylocella silvestris BL2]